MTMTLIEHIELVADQASVTISAIDQSYTDLLVVYSCRTDRAANSMDAYLIKPNGASATYRYLLGYGSATTAASGTTFAGIFPATNATANTFGNSSLYIPNYANTTQYKSFSVDDTAENNSTGTNDAFRQITAGLYSSNTAITSIEFVSTNAADIIIGSTFTIYGITAGSDGTTTVS